MLAAAALLAIVVAASASAAEPAPEFLLKFGETGSAAGQTKNARGIGTDPSNGHVYVADLSNQRISEFTAWGRFIRAFGWNVNASAPAEELQTCTEASGCQAGTGGGGVGQFRNPLSVAVDSSGDVYVVDFSNHRVEKFDAEGHFLLMFGGGVDQGPNHPGNLCTATYISEGDTCGAGATGTGPGEFESWKVGSFIAVDSSDVVYVGDANRVQEFEPSGSYKTELALPGVGKTEALALEESSGDLYVKSENDPGVRKLSPSGTVLGVLDPEGTPKAVATGPPGKVYVANNEGSGIEILEYSSSGTLLTSFAEGEIEESTGIGTNSVGDVYVSNSRPSPSYVVTYGPPPTAIEPPPSVPPSIDDQYAASVGVASAVLRARINPHFLHTTYYLQYGSEDCSAHPCTDVPAAPGAALGGEGGADVTASVQLAGLSSGTTYHYRFIAVSFGGTEDGSDATFATFAPETAQSCGNGSIRAAQAASYLPDCRAYEMVSPLAKNGGDVSADRTDVLLRFNGSQASLGGDAVAYQSPTAFAGSQSAPLTSQYLAARGSSGWSTAAIMPPQDALSHSVTQNRIKYQAFAADLSTGLLNAFDPPLAGAAAGYNNLYLRDNASASYMALTPSAPSNLPPAGPPAGSPQPELVVQAVTPGLEHVVFISTGDYVPGAIGSTDLSKRNLYEWSGGALHLVNVLPDGSVSSETSETGAGAGTNIVTNEPLNAERAIAADGSRIAWTEFEGGRQLYDRLNPAQPQSAVSGGAVDGSQCTELEQGKACTIQLDAAQGGPESGGGEYVGASADGSRVFFTDERKLVPATSTGTGNDLYEYDLEGPVGNRLTDLTVDTTDPEGAYLRSVVATSADGSSVYFLALGKLTPDAAPLAAGQIHLYLWHEGQVRFIANLLEGWDLSPEHLRREAGLSADGLHLAFRSLESIPTANFPAGYDNLRARGGVCFNPERNNFTSPRCMEVYLYDATANGGAGELRCASCNPSGARPLGGSSLPIYETNVYQPRFISADGSRLFFDSEDALVPRDTNGTGDVYEYENGTIRLISAGTGPEESSFADASASGNDVFFVTRDRLLGTDTDNNVDLYDARVKGGFPEAGSSAGCGGESSCRPTAPAPPAGAGAGSSAYEGSGNLHQRHHHKKRKRHHRRKHHRAARANRRAGK